MEVITLESEAYKKLIDEINSIKKQLHSPFPDETKAEWLNTEEAASYLKVSKRTLQNYRGRKLIKFCQIGSKILFKRSHLNDFLHHHLIG